MSRLAVAAAAALLLCGCGKWFRRGASPELVRVETLSAQFPGPDRAEFQLKLGIDNGHSHAGAITGIQWEVWLKGRFFAEGTQALARPLPPDFSELEVSLPAVFHATGARSPLGPLDVGVRGILGVQIEGEPVRLPFQRTLTVTAEGAPALAPGAEEE